MMDGDGASRIGRHVDTFMVVRPDRVWLNDTKLALLYDTQAPTVLDTPKANALDAFIGLAGASAEDICAFAQRFGVLDVDALSTPGIYAERLETWRRWIGDGQAILSSAASLQQHEPTSADAWQRIETLAGESAFSTIATFEEFRSDLPAKTRRVLGERLVLSDVLNGLLQRTGVRPCFSWLSGSGGILLTNLFGFFDEGSLTLSGYLTVQLVLACAGADAIAVCSGCGIPYMRRWHSVKGRRNYCSKCGLRAAWRDSKRARRNHVGSGKRSSGVKHAR
jgi:hypothetical protein